MIIRGYESAFALFYDDGSAAVMIPGSNYGALSHDEKFSGQTIIALAAGTAISLNRTDTLYPLDTLNQVSDGTPVTAASVSIIKIA